MTVNVQTNRISYTANGTLDTFAYTFKIFQDSDLEVYVDGVGKTITEDYTVTGAGESTGGNVVFVTPPAADTTVLIYGTYDLLQETDYEENDSFPADSHEDAIDKAYLNIIKLKESVDRSIRAPVTDANTLQDLPDATTRANKYLKFDSNGDIIAQAVIDETVISGITASADDINQLTDSKALLGNFFYPDPDEADQCVTATGSGDTIYDIAQGLTTNQYATIILRHTGEGNTTDYNIAAGLDLSSYNRLSFWFEHGAMIEPTSTGTLSLYSPLNLVFDNRQVITSDIDVFEFDVDQVKYGRVEVFPWTTATESNVRAANGLWIDVSSSNTDGVQEAIDLAYGDGTRGNATYNCHIHGREEDGSKGSYQNGSTVIYGIVGDTGLVFPAMQGAKFSCDGVGFFGSPSPLIQFDSMMMCDIDMSATQVIHAGSGKGIVFKPEHGVPVDGYITIIDSRIHINAVVTGATHSGIGEALIEFDTTYGGIGANNFLFEEINTDGSPDAFGVLIRTESGEAWTDNYFRCMHIHGIGAFGVHMGYLTSYDTIDANIMDLYVEGTSQTGSVGVKCFGQGNQINVASASKNFDHIVMMTADSNNNLLCYPNPLVHPTDYGINNKLITTTANRRDPSSFDYNVGAFTADNAWHLFNLSSIVPDFAKTVYLRVVVNNTAAGESFSVRSNANSNAIAVVGGVTQVAAQTIAFDLAAQCDHDRYCQYKLTASGTWNTVDVAVMGWDY